MRVVGILVPPEPSKICIGVVLDQELVARIKDEPFVQGSLAVSVNTFEGNLVGTLRREGEASALVDSEGNVRAAIATKVELMPTTLA